METTGVCVGMDLGTFKTSVAASTGLRDMMFSAVGWPKDPIARTLLGRDVVYGDDITDHRLALHVIRPFEKGTLKYVPLPDAGVAPARIEQYKEAARLLIEHAVSLTRPPKGVPIYGVIGAPARASDACKKVVLDAAQATFSAAMIVSEPFTIAYGLNRLSDIFVIDIGAGTTDLCPLSGAFPAEEDQLTLPIGGDHIDEYFVKFVREQHPDVNLTINMAREIKERYGFVHDLSEKVIITVPIGGRLQQLDVTAPLKEACRIIVEPIMQGLCELIARYDPDFQQRLLQNIVLGGGGSQLKGMDTVIEEAFKDYGGSRVRRVGDAIYAGAMGALKLAMSMPVNCWEEFQRVQQPVAAAA